MAITTYAELKAALADWLLRDDLTAVIPSFIALAEAQISRDIDHWRQEKRVTTTLDEQYENLPTDLRRMIQMQIVGGGQLNMISIGEMQARKQASAAAGKPRYYYINSGQIEFYPAPDGNYEIEMQYVARIPPLSDAAPGNWILDYAPDLYLYAALTHAAPYLQDDPRTQVWGSLYGTALQNLNNESMVAKSSGPLRMGVPR